MARIHTRARKKLLQIESNCHYCGVSVDSDATMTVDHKIPRCRGGRNDPENVVLCCRDCNAQKGDLPYDIFVKFLKDPKSLQILRSVLYHFPISGITEKEISKELLKIYELSESQDHTCHFCKKPYGPVNLFEEKSKQVIVCKDCYGALVRGRQAHIYRFCHKLGIPILKHTRRRTNKLRKDLKNYQLYHFGREYWLPLNIILLVYFLYGTAKFFTMKRILKLLNNHISHKTHNKIQRLMYQF